MKVGFIGLGSRRGRLSGSLLRNGTDVMVHDLNQDLVGEFVALGAKRAEGPADLMRSATLSSPAYPRPPPLPR